jgi:hypothetical protein
MYANPSAETSRRTGSFSLVTSLITDSNWFSALALPVDNISAMPLPAFCRPKPSTSTSLAKPLSAFTEFQKDPALLFAASKIY